MCRLAGTKPAPMPCRRCGLGSPPLMTADLAGSTAKVCRLGKRSLSASLTPVMWPPVPTPVMRKSTPSGKSRRISWAVASRWIAGLAGFSNCCGIQAPSICATSSSARAIAAFIPPSRGVSSSCGAVGGHQTPALERHRLRHDEDQPVAADRGDHRQADAGVARGRLDDRAARPEDAAALGVLDHREADAVLDRAARVRPLGLHPHVDLRAVGVQAVDADVRGVPDGLEDARGLHAASMS